MTIRITTAAALVATLTAPASFADAHIDLNFKVQACAALEPDDKRLQCYDRVALELRPTARLAEYFASIAMHYEAGGSLMEKLEFGAGTRELQGAFAAIESMQDWQDEILGLGVVSGLKVTQTLQGGVSAAQHRLAGCADAQDLYCIIESARELAVQYRELAGIVRSASK